MNCIPCSSPANGSSQLQFILHKILIYHYWVFSIYYTNKVPFKAHDTLWLVLLISKYNKPHVIFMRFNTCVFPFLLASWPVAHLSISEAKSLSSDYPPKPSTTITIKHLAAEPPIFVFTNMTNLMEPHSFLTTNQIRALPWFIVGRFAHENFFPRYPPLIKWNWFRPVIFFILTHTSRKLSFGATISKEVKHPFCACKKSCCQILNYYRVMVNGKHVECCGTSFSHTTTV